MGVKVKGDFAGAAGLAGGAIEGFDVGLVVVGGGRLWPEACARRAAGKLRAVAPNRRAAASRLIERIVRPGGRG
jgi:hypothetical protein